MILIDKHICYSPEPPAAYTYRRAGHGALLVNDIQAWNFAWLTCPPLDHYLETPPEHAMAKVAVCDLSPFGLAAMTVKKAHQTAIPDLRDMLRLEPGDFYNEMLNGPFTELLIYQTLGPAWIMTMASRIFYSREQTLPERPLTLTRDGGFELKVPIPKFYEKVTR